VGGPFLVGGLGPWVPWDPLNPALSGATSLCYFTVRFVAFTEMSFSLLVRVLNMLNAIVVLLFVKVLLVLLFS